MQQRSLDSAITAMEDEEEEGREFGGGGGRTTATMATATATDRIGGGSTHVARVRRTRSVLTGGGGGGGDNHKHNSDSQEDDLRIMTEIGNDEVAEALQVIIDQFGDHIEPHAVTLATQLSTAFQNYCGAGENDNDAVMAAAQCLECIATVLK